MKTFVSFLRGINVSRNNRISMPNLKQLYESLSLGNVSTYIQSGNVVFESFEENHSILSKKIEAGIKNTLGMDVRVIVRDQKELKIIIESNPLINDRKTEPEKLYVMFLSDLPKKLAVKDISATGDGGGSPQPLDSDSRVVNREVGVRNLTSLDSESRVVISKDGGGSPRLIDSESRVVISEEGSGSVKELSSSRVNTNSGGDEGSNTKPGPNWHGTNEGDEYIISGKEIYLFCSNGYGKTKFSNSFFERKLGITATTRNWKTVNALFEIVTQR
jgi:uncharacterized protein (DUF1697 family)